MKQPMQMIKIVHQANKKKIFLNIIGQYMKESNILVGDVTIKQLQKVILLNTKGQYMKESNILAGNATTKQSCLTQMGFL